MKCSRWLRRFGLGLGVAMLSVVVSGCSTVGCGKAEVFDGKVSLTIVRSGDKLEATGSIDGEEQGRSSGTLPRGAGGNWCSPQILSGAFRASIAELIKEKHGDACAKCPKTGKPCSLLVVIKNAQCSYSLSGDTCSISCPVGSVEVNCRKCGAGYPLCEVETPTTQAAALDERESSKVPPVFNQVFSNELVEVESCQETQQAVDPLDELFSDAYLHDLNS